MGVPNKKEFELEARKKIETMRGIMDCIHDEFNQVGKELTDDLRPDYKFCSEQIDCSIACAVEIAQELRSLMVAFRFAHDIEEGLEREYEVHL